MCLDLILFEIENRVSEQFSFGGIRFQMRKLKKNEFLNQKENYLLSSTAF